MPILDFDTGLATKFGAIYPTPGIPIEFMPEDLFERKRIVDKLNRQETFSFISFWRSGYTFDPNRWSPNEMFDNTVGHYNGQDLNSVTMYNLFPVIFDYSLFFWETKRELIDLHSSMMFKNLYRNPIMTTEGSELSGITMRCYMDFDYKLNISDEYHLEKSEKVPFFKGKFDFKLEGWLYDSSSSGPGTDLIHHVHTFVYVGGQFSYDIWVPDAESGYPSGESGLPSGVESGDY